MLRTDPDIARAQTPPGWFYTDPAIFRLLSDRVLRPSWRFAGSTHDAPTPGSVFPFELALDGNPEPLALVRDHEDTLRCLSNVCTHRAMRLIEHPGQSRSTCLTCPYHGRRFELDGRFRSMPEFDDAENFPRPEDDLQSRPLEPFGPLLFTSIGQRDPFEDLIAPIRDRLSFLPLDRAKPDPTRAREYHVRAHWALYIENYLEGFHIPFVHASLSDALDYGSYTTELYPLANLQLGVASSGEDTFDLPPDHRDAETPVAAFYYWLFPTTMLNVYPWGISVNNVEPITPDRTRVRFVPYVWDASRLDSGAGADLDRVEREDERVVEAIQRSIGSSAYTTGRYSPTREQGVHHFHRLLSERLG